MRKLIANFLLVTIGGEWFSETSPNEIKSTVDKSKRVNDQKGNALYNIDFIQLADFLLKAYSSTSSQDIYKKISSATQLEDLESIKKLLPESNWKRYFSSLVKCEDTFLQKRWSELYELRCKVAHNALVVQADFDKIQTLASELTEKLQEAIDKLPKVKVPESDVEYIFENAAGNANAILGEFLTVWRNLESRILGLAASMDFFTDHVVAAAHKLLDCGRIDVQQLTRIKIINEARNLIVHQRSVETSEAEIFKATKLALSLLNSLDSSSESAHVWATPFKKTDSSAL